MTLVRDDPRARARAQRRARRNPLFELAAVAQLAELALPQRTTLGLLLQDLEQAGTARGEQAWRQCKGPVAVYHLDVSSVARHLRQRLVWSEGGTNRTVAAFAQHAHRDSPVDEPRANRAEVRNPILALHAVAHLRALPPSLRSGLALVLSAIQRESGEQAKVLWARRDHAKAAFFKAVGVYAGHARRAFSEDAIRRHNAASCPAPLAIQRHPHPLPARAAARQPQLLLQPAGGRA